MQSDPLADRTRFEEPTRNRRASRSEADRLAKADRMTGGQQFLVEWEVPETA